MLKRVCFLFAFVSCAAVYGQQSQEATANPAPASVKMSPDQVKARFIAMVDSITANQDAEYSAMVVNITVFKKETKTDIDSSSVKLSSSGISAMKVTTGEAIKQTVTMMVGKIGNRELTKMDVGKPIVTPISHKRQVESYVTTTAANGKSAQ